MTINTSRARLLSLALTFALLIPTLIACASGSSKETDTTKADISENKKSAEKPEDAKQTGFDLSKYAGPNFDLQLTNKMQKIKLTDYFGKGAPVVLNFWGTWCGPCRREMPEFKKIYSEYKDEGVEIIGLALRDTPARVNSYVTQQGIEWPQVVGGYKEAMDFGGITGVPTTIFYDSKGEELTRYVGPMPYTLLKNNLDKAIAREKTLKQL